MKRKAVYVSVDTEEQRDEIYDLIDQISMMTGLRKNHVLYNALYDARQELRSREAKKEEYQDEYDGGNDDWSSF